MKIIKWLIVIIGILLVVFFVGASAYVQMYGKDILEDTLKASIKRDVSLGKMTYLFPFSLKAEDIKIGYSNDGGKFFEAKDILAELSVDSIYEKRLMFNLVILTDPFISIERLKDLKRETDLPDRRYGVVVPPGGSGVSPESKSSTESDVSISKTKTEVVIKKLILKKGVFKYINTTGEKDFSFSLEDIYLSTANLSFPSKSSKTDFHVSGRLIKEGNPLSGSSLKGHGWVDIVKRDMDARVEVIEQDGSVGLTAEAVSKDNDMAVTGEIKFQNLLSGGGERAPSGSSSVDNLVLNALSSSGVEIGAQFSFNTKMDNFKPERVSFSGSVVTK